MREEEILCWHLLRRQMKECEIRRKNFKGPAQVSDAIAPSNLAPQDLYPHSWLKAQYLNSCKVIGWPLPYSHVCLVSGGFCGGWWVLVVLEG